MAGPERGWAPWWQSPQHSLGEEPPLGNRGGSDDDTVHPGAVAMIPVRAATGEDAEELVRLAAALFASMGIDTAMAPWQEAAGDNVRARLGNDVAAFVAEHPSERGRLIASAAGSIAHRLPTPRSLLGRSGYVQWVYTEPAFRGQGIARRAMVALLEWFDAQEVASVELHATEAAEPLYRSLGFGDGGPKALRRRRPQP